MTNQLPAYDAIVFDLERDRALLFDGACPVLEEVEEDVYSNADREPRRQVEQQGP